jgi:hypothetical protein
MEEKTFGEVWMGRWGGESGDPTKGQKGSREGAIVSEAIVEIFYRTEENPFTGESGAIEYTATFRRASQEWIELFATDYF